MNRFLSRVRHSIPSALPRSFENENSVRKSNIILRQERLMVSAKRRSLKITDNDECLELTANSMVLNPFLFWSRHIRNFVPIGLVTYFGQNSKRQSRWHVHGCPANQHLVSMSRQSSVLNLWKWVCAHSLLFIQVWNPLTGIDFGLTPIVMKKEKKDFW